LVLTTGGRVIEGFHQDAQQMPWFRRKYPEPVVRLHPETAARHGVEDGAYVEVATPVGSVCQRARVTRDVRPGVVQADRWWFPEGSNDPADPFGVHATNINVCTDDAPANVDPVMGTWLLRGLPCRIGGRRLTTGQPDTPPWLFKFQAATTKRG
jgi:anaerobic selenocysteine-containing dehydrogenase